MPRTFSLVLLAAIFAALMPCQSAAASVLWNRTYGGAYGEDALSVVAVPDGGYAFAGATFSYSLNSPQYSDNWLVKTDSSGNVLWNKSFGGAYDEVGRSLVRTQAGGYALAGYTRSPSGGAQKIITLAWLDSSGNMIGGGPALNGYPYDTEGFSAVQLPDGSYAVGGSIVENKYGGAYSSDAWLVKYDSSGVMQWNQTNGGAYDDAIYSIINASGGGFASAGYSKSMAGGTHSEMVLMKTDSAGNAQWANPYDPTSYDAQGNSVVEAQDGGFAIAGYSADSGGKASIFVAKADANGRPLWNTTISGAYSQSANAIINTPDGGFMLAGYSQSYSGGARKDAFIMKLDSSGNRLWDLPLGTGYDSEARSLALSPDGSYIVAGYTNTSGGHTDAYLADVSAGAPPGPDTTPPVTLAEAYKAGNLQPYAFGTWTNQNVAITLTCTDNNTQAVCDTINWRDDYGVPGPCTGFFWHALPPATSFTEQYSVNVTFYSSDNAALTNNEACRSLEVDIDKNAPEAYISRPYLNMDSRNDPSTTSGIWNLTYSVADYGGSGLDSCWYSIDGGQSVSLPGCQNITLPPFLLDGVYNVSVYANDTAGNVGEASTMAPVEFSLPEVNAISPPSGSILASRAITVNFSVADLDLSLTYVSVYNTTGGLVNTTVLNTTENGTYSATVSVPADGHYNIIVNAEDRALFYNYTDISNLTVLSSPPLISIEAPLNDTYNSSNVPLSFTASSAGALACSYSLDGAANVPLPGCANTTLAGVPAGGHSVSLFVSDEAGNAASSPVSFTVYSAPPHVSANTTVNMMLRNSAPQETSLEKISIDGEVFVLPGPILFSPGERRLVGLSVPRALCAKGELAHLQIGFFYKQGLIGGMVEHGVFPLVARCS